MKANGLDLVICKRCEPPHRVQRKDMKQHDAALDARERREHESRREARAESAKRQQRAAAKAKGRR